MNLDMLKINKSGIIINNDTKDIIYQRLTTLGFLPNAIVKKVQIGKKESIAIYEINNMLIALRKSEAKNIWIKEI